MDLSGRAVGSPNETFFPGPRTRVVPLSPCLPRVKYEETIADLKRKVGEKLGVPADKQQARYPGVISRLLQKSHPALGLVWGGGV